MKPFNEAWTATSDETGSENVFKANIITLALDGSKDRLARKKLPWKEMLKFRKTPLQSKLADTLKLLGSEMKKLEGINRGWYINDIQPNEGRELFRRELTIRWWVVISLEYVSNPEPSTSSDDQQVKIPEATSSPHPCTSFQKEVISMISFLFLSWLKGLLWLFDSSCLQNLKTFMVS